jgi:putative DNA primase/helicase
MTADSNIIPLPAARSGYADLAGDHLNASRFMVEIGDDVRRSPELGKWFLWSGAWWEEDRLDMVRDLAGSTIDNLRAWVGEADGIDEYKKRNRHYEQSARAGRRDALLDLVGTMPGIVVSVDELDAHPLLLACRNGTLDLRTGELLAPQRAHMLTRGINVDYIPAARSEVWERFIDTTFGADADLIGFVQRLLGYCVTGVVADHVLPVFHGQGANGKSTLIGVVQDLLGNHAMTAPEGLVIRNDHTPHPERIASLRGMRLVVSNELEAKARLAEQQVKMLTGADTLTARELYKDRFSFKPSHKIVLVTNHRPSITGSDYALWRRLKLVPFDSIVAPEDQDPDLRRSLVEDHGPAVLSWLVEGARAWSADGLGEAEAVTVATAAYRDEQDAIGIFLAEQTVEEKGQRAKVGELWESWRIWCERGNERSGRKQDFSAALADRGFEIETYQNAKSVRGLGIRESREVSLGLPL